MDKRQVLEYAEALNLVRKYKQAILHRFPQEPKVMMYGSYSKGYATSDSDIDVAVIVPTYGDRKMELSQGFIALPRAERRPSGLRRKMG